MTLRQPSLAPFVTASWCTARMLVATSRWMVMRRILKLQLCRCFMGKKTCMYYLLPSLHLRINPSHQSFQILLR